jgi:hypothetical protein
MSPLSLLAPSTCPPHIPAHSFYLDICILILYRYSSVTDSGEPPGGEPSDERPIDSSSRHGTLLVKVAAQYGQAKGPLMRSGFVHKYGYGPDRPSPGPLRLVTAPVAGHPLPWGEGGKEENYPLALGEGRSGGHGS